MSQVSGFHAMRFKEPAQAAGQVSTLTRIKSRRRPGRKNHVNPHLIPLLRSPTTMNVPAPIGEMDMPSSKYDLAPVQGIIFSLVLSMPLWGVIAGVLWEVLR